jgi:cysteinyl-tRNA synthetase
MLRVLALENLLAVEPEQAPDQVLELVKAREDAREARDWAEADRLRDQVRELGWEVRDGPDGPEVLAPE